jgi:hypothetical protein
MEFMMTIEKKIEVIQRDIFWNLDVANQSKDKAQRERCLNRVESFRQDLADLKRKMKEIDLDIMSLDIICDRALELP